jgi:hypothetical protein
MTAIVVTAFPAPEDQLLVQFQGMIAEYERAQIAERLAAAGFTSRRARDAHQKLQNQTASR